MKSVLLFLVFASSLISAQSEDQHDKKFWACLQREHLAQKASFFNCLTRWNTCYNFVLDQNYFQRCRDSSQFQNYFKNATWESCQSDFLCSVYCIEAYEIDHIYECPELTKHERILMQMGNGACSNDDGQDVFRTNVQRCMSVPGPTRLPEAFSKALSEFDKAFRRLHGIS